MPIVTRDEVKELMQIKNSDLDVEIQAYIPIVQQFILDYCNNLFLNGSVYYYSSGIAFVNGGDSVDTITDSNSGFVDAFFHANMDLYIDNSYNNCFHVFVESIVAGTLTLSKYDSLVNEAAGNRTIYLVKAEFSASLKMTAAKMINFNLQKVNNEGIKSKSLADWSETYLGEGGYPKKLLQQLEPFRKTSLG